MRNGRSSDERTEVDGIKTMRSEELARSIDRSKNTEWDAAQLFVRHCSMLCWNDDPHYSPGVADRADEERVY